MAVAQPGESTVGYDVYLRSLAAGHMTGFVDLQQIGFFWGTDGHGLKAANLAAVWRRFHEHGARRMVGTAWSTGLKTSRATGRRYRPPR